MKAFWLSLGVLALCASARAEDAPTYDRQNILSSSQLTPVPYARFMNIEAFKAYKKCVQQNIQNKKPQSEGCTKYDFTAPYSLDTETLRVATDLRTAWQRLEDRYYWRAMLELNNPSMFLSHCFINWQSGNGKADQAPYTLNVADSMVPNDIAGKLPTQNPDPRLRLDGYSVFPHVSNRDYCGDYSLDFWPMYLPGTCTYIFGARVFCIQGTKGSMNPLAPNPIGFDESRAVERVKSAIKKANTDYMKEYVQDVLKALKPTVKFFPLVWSGLTDAVVAPTMQLKPDLAFIKNKGQEAGNAYGGIFKSTAPLYYLQGLSGPTLPLRAHLLPPRKDVLGVGNPPGVWKLEEFKRSFPLNNPTVYERFGYTTLFQAWNEVRPRLLPEEPSAKFMRQMIYMAEGNNVYLPNVTPVPIPAPMLISAFSAGLPYAGPQTQYTWVSVPEGYDVPRVSGLPTVDYSAVTK